MGDTLKSNCQWKGLENPEGLSLEIDHMRLADKAQVALFFAANTYVNPQTVAGDPKVRKVLEKAVEVGTPDQQRNASGWLEAGRRYAASPNGRNFFNP